MVGFIWCSIWFVDSYDDYVYHHATHSQQASRNQSMAYTNLYDGILQRDMGKIVCLFQQKSIKNGLILTGIGLFNKKIVRNKLIISIILS